MALYYVTAKKGTTVYKWFSEDRWSGQRQDEWEPPETCATEDEAKALCRSKNSFFVNLYQGSWLQQAVDYLRGNRA